MFDDYDFDGYNEPYFCHVDHGLGMCEECGSFLENWGACSDGDGDMYDEIGCPNCQEQRGQANKIYINAWDDPDRGDVPDDEPPDQFWDDDDFLITQIHQ